MKIVDLVKAYIDVRNTLTDKRKEFKDFEDIAKSQMSDLEAQLLTVSDDTGVTSFKTDYGTAFKTTKDYCRIAPGARDQVNLWVLESGHVEIFTSHISKLMVKELMEADENPLVPIDVGLEYIEEFVMQIRKPTN